MALSSVFFIIYLQKLWILKKYFDEIPTLWYDDIKLLIEQLVINKLAINKEMPYVCWKRERIKQIK